MKKIVVAILFVVTAFASAQTGRGTRRNVIVFVADGLRAGSVNATDTPTFWSIRQQGVNFANSHSLFPTFTMANASAISTGHALGDTGIFSNVLWVGYPTYSGTPVPFIENDQMLMNIHAHFKENFPTEKSLLTVVAQHGYNTASIGKLGPAGLFGIGTATALVIDDATGSAAGFSLPPAVITAMKDAGLSTDAPTRNNGYAQTSAWNNGYAGNAKQPGTQQANVVQQQWFADVATRAVLPMFKRDAKPFLVFYWSRDPDGTQHNQGDSPGLLSPGINGKTVQLALRNADRNLRQILDWLDQNPIVKANTDIFITSDHGFATISKREIASGVLTTSESARHNYIDANGNIETESGTLPYGFLAIDLALRLKTNLFDPDQRAAQGSAGPFRQIRIGPGVYERPSSGNGLIGSEVRKEDGSDAVLIVAANGGSDLLYVPDKSVATVRRVTEALTTFDYVGGIFVDDAYGPVPGALPMSELAMVGSTPVPRPAIVVAFKVFYLTPGNLQTAVQVSDASQQHGQGMHGGLGRDSTFNNMAAIGPDFRARYVDSAPVSNADIVPTLAHILGLEVPSQGTLRGRVILEALRGNTTPTKASGRQVESPPAGDRKTILHVQELNGTRYVDRGCFVEKVSSCP